MDRNGPQWTTMDRNGPQWTAMDLILGNKDYRYNKGCFVEGVDAEDVMTSFFANIFQSFYLL